MTLKVAESLNIYHTCFRSFAGRSGIPILITKLNLTSTQRKDGVVTSACGGYPFGILLSWPFVFLRPGRRCCLFTPMVRCCRSYRCSCCWRRRRRSLLLLSLLLLCSIHFFFAVPLLTAALEFCFYAFLHWIFQSFLAKPIVDFYKFRIYELYSMRFIQNSWISFTKFTENRVKKLFSLTQISANSFLFLLYAISVLPDPSTLWHGKLHIVGKTVMNTKRFLFVVWY